MERASARLGGGGAMLSTEAPLLMVASSVDFASDE